MLIGFWKSVRSVTVLYCIILLAFFGLSCSNGGGGSGNDSSSSEFSGNWSETDGDNGTFILDITLDGGNFFGTYDVVKLTNEGGSYSYTMSGTRNGNNYQGVDNRGRIFTFQIINNQLSGTYYDPDGGETGTYSSSINSGVPSDCIGSGTLVVLGEFCGDYILLNSDDACIEFPGVSDDDIEINVWTNAPRFGIEIESDEMLYSGATFDIQGDSFQIDFQSDIVFDCWPIHEIRATDGTVTVNTYGGGQLVGNFNITLENGDEIQGSFDVEY